MNKKEIYILTGVVALLIVFVLWNSNSGTKPEAPQVADNTGTPAPVVTKPASKPSSTPKSPSSVNPTVVPPKPTPVVPTAQELNGSTYRLASYNGVALPADTKFTLSFNTYDFTLKLCNTMSSGYFISGNIIKANNLISTQMYCGSPANIMRIESDVALMFNSNQVTIYKSGSSLILSHNSGITLGFEGF